MPSPAPTPAEALHQRAKRLLGSADGQHLMHALRRRTIERPTFPATSNDGQSMALLMALREGENNLYRWLESLCRDPQPTPQQETTHD